MDAWTVVGLLVFAAVALLFILDALSKPTIHGKLAGLLFITAAVSFGVDLVEPWLPIGLLVAAVTLHLAGRSREAEVTDSTG